MLTLESPHMNSRFMPQPCLGVGVHALDGDGAASALPADRGGAGGEGASSAEDSGRGRVFPALVRVRRVAPDGGLAIGVAAVAVACGALGRFCACGGEESASPSSGTCDRSGSSSGIRSPRRQPLRVSSHVCSAAAFSAAALAQPPASASEDSGRGSHIPSAYSGPSCSTRWWARHRGCSSSCCLRSPWLRFCACGGEESASPSSGTRTGAGLRLASAVAWPPTPQSLVAACSCSPGLGGGLGSASALRRLGLGLGFGLSLAFSAAAFSAAAFSAAAFSSAAFLASFSSSFMNCFHCSPGAVLASLLAGVVVGAPSRRTVRRAGTCRRRNPCARARRRNRVVAGWW